MHYVTAAGTHNKGCCALKPTLQAVFTTIKRYIDVSTHAADVTPCTTGQQPHKLSKLTAGTEALLRTNHVHHI